MNQNTIIRAPRSGDSPYFSTARAAAQDRAISFEARGLLWYLLSKPDNWSVKPKDLEQQCGRSRVYRIITELRVAGYLEYHEGGQDASGKFASGYYNVYEIPRVENQHTDLEKKPCVEKPDTENQHVTDKRSTKDRTSTEDRKDIAANAAPVEIEPKPLTEHQVMFGELCEVFGYDPKTLDKSDEKEIGGVVGKLRAKKAKPGDIKAEFHWLKNVRGPSLGFSTFTMHAMVTHHKDFRVWQQKTLNATPIGLTPDQLAMREAHTLLSQAAAHE